MSLFYNNDPFWSFFDNINEEVNNFNRILNSSARNNNKQLTNGKNNSQVAKKSNDIAGTWLTSDPFFNNSSLFNFGSSVDFTPPVDLIDNDKSYELHVSVPGASKDDITIDFNKDENQLVIKGSVPSAVPESDDKKNNHHIERASGTFERKITLPTKIDGDKIKATFENGVLKLDVTKLEDSDLNKVRRIEISSSESYSS